MQAQAQGGIPACTEADTPTLHLPSATPSRWLLLQAVRILLECILVFQIDYFMIIPGLFEYLSENVILTLQYFDLALEGLVFMLHGLFGPVIN